MVSPGEWRFDQVEGRHQHNPLGADGIRQSCDLDQGACVLWLEGYWRELLPMPGLPGLDVGPKAYPFDVRGVGGPVDPATASVLIAK